MKIGRKIWALIVAGGLLAGMSSQAIPITGSIGLFGSYTLDTGDLGTATAFTSFPLVGASSGTGTYTGVNSFGVTMAPFTFNPFSGSVMPLWTFTVGTTTYSFDLTSLTLDTQNSSTLILNGSGMLHVTGYDDTAGDWVFTANQSSGLLKGAFTFSSSNGSVPDGGTTVMLLGCALAVLGLARRYVKA
jgi:VPDSG-CTERM motif